MSNREPERDGERKDAGAKTDRPAISGTGPAAQPGPESRADRAEPAAQADEEALFGEDTGPSVFGEGSYRGGGPPGQGNYEVRDRNPHGSSGNFDDAGGYGGTELLGEKPPAVEPAGRARPVAPKEASERADRK
ncbi:MAG: hypothetical protein ACREUG_01555 [Steroidobacteraceae bacterium]